MNDTLEIPFEGDTTVSLPNNINYTPIKYIIINEGFTRLPPRVFTIFPNLLNITLPESLETIDDGGFDFISLIKYLFIPKGVRILSAGNPFDTGPIEYIDVDQDNPYFCSVDGILFYKDMTILYCFSTCKNMSTYMVPNAVTRFGYGAFNRAKYLKKIYIPDSVVDLSTEFLCQNGNVIEEVIIFRYFRQSLPYIGPNSFTSTKFQKSNIKYIVISAIIY